MTVKSNSWTKYSKDMAASVIQTRWRKYWAIKNGLLDESMDKLYGIVRKKTEMNKIENAETLQLEINENNAYSPPDAPEAPETARTDQQLLDFGIEDDDGDAIQVQEQEIKKEEPTTNQNNTIIGDIALLDNNKPGDIFSDCEELDESVMDQKKSNISAIVDRDVKAKDHRYIVRRPLNWTDNVLTEK